jgi:hypothetical protein
MDIKEGAKRALTGTADVTKRAVTGTADVTRRVVTGTADATSAAAGAVGGAAVTGVIGGVEGTARWIRNGLSTGSHSTPLAVLTLATVGAVGLVEWPILLTVGGGALLVHQLSRRNKGQARSEATKSTAKTTSRSPAKKASTSSTGRATSRQPAKKASRSAPRKTTRSRSTKR